VSLKGKSCAVAQRKIVDPHIQICWVDKDKKGRGSECAWPTGWRSKESNAEEDLCCSTGVNPEKGVSQNVWHYWCKPIRTGKVEDANADEEKAQS